MEEAVREFLIAKKMPETLRVFVNTYLGESWEDEGEQIDEIGIYNRREDYLSSKVQQEIPDSIVVITAGVPFGQSGATNVLRIASVDRY